VSQAKRGGRFSYLTSAEESPETRLLNDTESRQETESGSAVKQDDSQSTTDSNGGGGERTSHRATRDELATVPKGKGRMKQERSQLNVRIPTTLKRQASAKAVLEGRDIGEVIEELLREYLDR